MDKFRNDEEKFWAHVQEGMHHTEDVAIILSDKGVKAFMEWKPLGENHIIARFNSK